MSSFLIMDTKTYNLSTRSSSSLLLNDDYKSKVQFSIPDMIYRDDSIEYINFSIPYAVIPNSFYTVNENNNKLVVTENNTTTIYTFEKGNYNANLFMTKFKQVLGIKWNISLDFVNSVFTISNTDNNFTFGSSSTIDSVLGFSGTYQSTNKSLTLPRCCNFLALPRIILRCPELANGFMVGNISSGDIVLSIPNNAKPNGEIVYTNQIKHLLKNDKIDKLTFSFTDDDGNLIDFNGLSSFFTIQFDIYRKYLEKPASFNEIKNNVYSKMI